MNPDKRRELATLMAGAGLDLVSLADVPGASAPEETGTTLLENARIKARAAASLTGLPALADDTGLEVDALGGRPGVHAARYAGPGATYADNVARLLAELTGVPAERRGARFRTVCLVCEPDGLEIAADGVVEGSITEVPRGTSGFGYDPVFEVEGLGRTLAELTPEEKNRHSHRARAARNLLIALGRGRGG
jgi:XTP/dITP diphosphohydrolase